MCRKKIISETELSESEPEIEIKTYKRPNQKNSKNMFRMMNLVANLIANPNQVMIMMKQRKYKKEEKENNYIK